MKKTDKDKFMVLSIRMTKKEGEMIKNLRNDHCVNISRYVRKCLMDLSEKMSVENEN